MWQVVLGALLADAIGGCDEDVREETWLLGRDVREPATHGIFEMVETVVGFVVNTLANWLVIIRQSMWVSRWPVKILCERGGLHACVVASDMWRQVLGVVWWCNTKTDMDRRVSRVEQQERDSRGQTRVGAEKLRAAKDEVVEMWRGGVARAGTWGRWRQARGGPLMIAPTSP